MKKILVCSCLLVLGAFLVHAGDTRSVPTTPQGLSLQFADYGGVDYSTSSFHTNHTTASITNAVVYGVFISTGSTVNLNDFVDVWDATSVVNTANLIPLRIYNATSTVTNTTSGFSGPPKPVRFKNGIIWRASVATYNSIYLLFWKE